ncbi:putative 1,3-beta-glucan synthase [Helianthus annuus]|nr:putative 1,3-beta-glucan synthase [Helianthus annuus]
MARASRFKFKAIEAYDYDDTTVDSEIVPSSLASVGPILRVANEVEKDDRRVAYLCRKHAFEKASSMDPQSVGSGVIQFKTSLLRKLEKEHTIYEVETYLPYSITDSILIQRYYQDYYEENIKKGQYTKKPEKMAKIYQTAAILYDVLSAQIPASEVKPEIQRYAKDVEEKKEQYERYNILPLYAVGDKPAIMELPQIKAALRSIRNVDSLLLLRKPEDSNKAVNDILEWLSLIFGFQKGNVANQREHLVLLLANISTRAKGFQESKEVCIGLLNDHTIPHLMRTLFMNYSSWCDHLQCTSNLKFGSIVDWQQMSLLYIGLYLLIWGEASNIRFMPECICYIFHNMAKELNSILFNVESASGSTYQAKAIGEESFLQTVVVPIYEVICKEAERNKGGRASHSSWRNYDDLNEYFWWSDKCFNLEWPMNLNSDFFVRSDPKEETHVTLEKRKSKINFVEVRTFLHLYRSFDRMWMFLILVFQAMLIISWHGDGSIFGIFDNGVFESILSIFITSAVLNFFQASIDIILSFNAWRSLKSTQILRYLLKFTVSVFWVVILPIAYSRSVYYYLVASYLTPNALSALRFLFPPLRRCMERSDWRLVVFLMWWAQPELYVGRGMHENMVTLMKYTLYWMLLLISKFTFSYYMEILPLVAPTKIIMELSLSTYDVHEVIPNGTHHNIGVVIAMWAPIVMVYFMDVQIWYAIFSTIIGGISGAFNLLGEIRTLRMLRLRFTSVPGAICYRLVPTQTLGEYNRSDYYRRKMAFFSQVWNEFIISMRTEDLISNRERDLLLVPYRTSDDEYIQWPLFLLAIKITIALDMVKGFEGNKDEDLFIKFSDDYYMYSALNECYQTVKDILLGLLDDELDKKIILFMDDDIRRSLENGLFLRTICLSGFPSLVEKLEKLLSRLLTDFDDEKKYTIQIVNALQDLMETILHDVMKNEMHKSLVERALSNHQNNDKKERFELINIGLTQNKSWKQKVARLHLLLTVKDPSFNMPMNLDARRRITFFTNSLFTNMPNAPTVSNMMSFSVLTPYYKEDVLYSEEELDLENEDGISILYYLQKIYPDEWQNFEERISNPKLEATEEDRTEATRQWASYRGQTLSRTVRGMMYYKEALDLQCFLECADDREIISGYRTSDMNIHSALKKERQQALADLKFTYVVSCQLYGAHKKSRDDKNQRCYADILKLLLTYPSLRVAYIDEREDTINGMSKKLYYSVLVKGGDKLDEEIYRIKLPGPPAEIGEGKPENQNHAIIFTRGEALQTIDMNQDNYFEEAYKMRNVLEEFYKDDHGERRPTILGLREHIFTGSVSSLAWFMSNQESTFVTIAQRVLAYPLRVRFHYGHPDIFDRIFHITRGGVSKASKVINLSEDIFSGYNSTLRGGHVTHHEYIQVGKGRDVGMNQISLFEAKVANGSGEQTLSRDVYRLGQHFDFYRMLSFYFTTVGFYFSSMVTVLVVYIFLYGQTYMVLSGLERQIMEKAAVSSNRALEKAIATQSFFQVGLLLVLPMAMETGLESGFRHALGDFIIMQLQLASVFFSFQLGTKAHYYGRAILHGGSKYRATGRGFVIFHVKFAENYRLYSRSHFVKGIELALLLVICQAYGESYWSSDSYSFINLSIWFLVLSWLFAPFVFNPSGFDWQKTVEDWTDWKQWMGNSDWDGFAEDKSWVSWWNLEREHLKYTNIRGRCMEIVLAFRFFFFQYGLVYHLNIAHGSRSLMVYGLSWFVMIPVLLSLKMISMGRQYIGMDYHFVFRILKALLFLGCLSTVIVLFVVCGLTYSDIFVSFLAFLPTGWAFLLIGQACRPYIKDRGLWDSITEMGRAYEWLMGLAIFLPIAVLSWFSFVSEFQTRLLFNQAFSRGLQISMILAGRKDKSKSA